MSRIVIGDVHGCYKTLLALITKLPAGVPITFAGDLIDRGPDSRRVVQYVIDHGHDCVKGNHEDMMVNYQDRANPAVVDYDSLFVMNGGLKTMESYYVFPADFKLHADWMRSLPVYIEYPEIKREDGRHLVVSHSAVGNVWKHRNNEEKRAMFEENVMWDRDRFLDQPEIFNIFGHTPQANGARIKSFFANIDTGAVFAREGSDTYGVLTALQFPEMVVFTQKNVEKDEE